MASAAESKAELSESKMSMTLSSNSSSITTNRNLFWSLFSPLLFFFQGMKSTKQSTDEGSYPWPRCDPSKLKPDLTAGIAKGGQSYVYQGTYGHRSVAIKYPKDDPGVIDPTKKDSTVIDYEMQALVRLRHPNIVTLVGYIAGTSTTYPCIVMELYDYSLRDIIKSNKKILIFLSFLDILSILIQIAIAIVYVHKKGIIHGDIKPGNILIGNDGEEFIAVLSDFGSYKEAEINDDNSQSISDGGTLKYRDIKSHPKRTKASDIYSFGMVIEEVCNYLKQYSNNINNNMNLNKYQILLNELDNLSQSCKSNPSSAKEVLESLQKIQSKYHGTTTTNNNSNNNNNNNNNNNSTSSLGDKCTFEYNGEKCSGYMLDAMHATCNYELYNFENHNHEWNGRCTSCHYPSGQHPRPNPPTS